KVLAARIKDVQLREQQNKEAATRKSLIGSGDRSERIRTYNFPQGRMTDHRINLTLYKLDFIMDGDLEELTTALTTEHQADLLASLDANCCHATTTVHDDSYQHFPIHSIMTTRNSTLLAIARTAIGLLMFPLYLQHIRGMQPCPLCVIQRYLFAVIAILSLVATLLPPSGARVAAGISALTAIAGTGVAGW